MQTVPVSIFKKETFLLISLGVGWGRMMFFALSPEQILTNIKTFCKPYTTTEKSKATQYSYGMFVEELYVPQNTAGF